MFHHIPLPETWKALTSTKVKGDIDELLCAPSVNSKFFDRVRQENSIVGDFFGHDHNNDFEATFDGVLFAYGRKTGFGSYGPDEFSRGGRVIELQETEKDGKCDFEFKTWVINDKGEK